MEHLKKIAVFFGIPILIILLLYVNADLQAKKYENKTSDLKQYNVQIKSDIEAIQGKPAGMVSIPLEIKNLGTMAWMKTDNNSINLSYHILNEDNEVVIQDGERTILTHPVKSSEEIQLDAVVQAPDQEGVYYIEFDMVHEGVTWFKEKGSKTLKIKLEVE